jgi:hypothetical protein
LFRLHRLLGDCLRRQHRRLDDDGNNFLDGRNGFDGDDAAPRAGNSNQQEKEANRIHPGELEIRVPVCRWQAKPGQLVFQLVTGDCSICVHSLIF